MPMDPTIFEDARNGNSDSSENSFNNVDPKAQVTARKNSLLHVSVSYGNKRSTQQILDLHPWLVHDTNDNGDIPLHIAARLGNLDLVKLITSVQKKDGGVAAGEFPLRSMNIKKDTALHEAVRYGHSDVVNLLLKEDPDLVYVCNDSGESPLFMAVDNGFYKIAGSILDSISDCLSSGASCRSGRDGLTVMHAVACQEFHPLFLKPKSKSLSVTLIRIFLMLLFKLSGLIPLLETRYNQSIITYQELVSKLVEKCNSQVLEEKDKRGRTALHYAAYTGKAKVVELFLQRNRSLAYIKDDQGMSAMHIAAMKGHIDVINELVKHCPDVCELLDNNNQTPLHVAVKRGRAHAVWNFLRRSDHFDCIIEPNEQDKEGNTPLHVAALSGHLEVLAMLAKHPKVVKKAINRKGMTPIDITMSSEQLHPYQKRLVLRSLKSSGEKQRLEKRLDSEITRTSLPYKYYPPPTTQDPQPQPLIISQNGEEDKEQLHNKKQDTIMNNISKPSSDHKSLLKFNLVVATIIASITFNTDGMPNLTNISAAFGFAAASLFIHLLFETCWTRMGLEYPIFTVLALTEFSILCTVSAFIDAVVLEQKDKQTSEQDPANIVELSFGIPILLHTLFTSLEIARYNYYVISSKIYIKETLRRMSNYNRM
ncbi:uncharacterized protein LOC133790177 isoform X2 [Humulus lupulus]|uniref:uncharacterized protein LOC133790177 isoform X2 n=1 Tax=Humulus lupulus TaxID=3486 RepID=UPI002B40DED7|nr:uncharacterized protein LOC133790177 isoform X2 [Humulus lupulus]